MHKLNPYSKNPRKITKEQSRILAKGLERYGDLGGIVFNVRQQELVGGHQRSQVFSDKDEIVYTEKFQNPDEQGTVALGYIVHNRKKYAYREVDWAPEDHAAACILANRAGGSWDWGVLKELTQDLKTNNIDLELTGFELPKLDQLLNADPAEILGELSNDKLLSMSDLKNQQSELVDLSLLKPHPRNYRKHPADQVQHLVESLKTFGFYKNIVVAKDYTILTGHGMFEAAIRCGIKLVPVKKMDIDKDDTRALKILTNDNELGAFAEIDDRALSELLKEIKLKDPTGLLGTGYTDEILANLVMITRPASEIADIDEAAEWIGMPDFENGETPYKLIVSFANAQDKAELYKILNLPAIDNKHGKTSSIWWPQREREDIKSVRFEKVKADA